jgi:Protein of unknown function (DUF2800)
MMIEVKDIHCSKLARPMVCAGSLFFEDLHKEEMNPAAEEGTAFGEMMERMLTTGQTKIPELKAKNGIHFSKEMEFYALPLFDEIMSKANGKVLCEQKIDWQTRSGIWIKGKYDASFIHDGKLYIDDFKYGWGIVEAKNNWQLLGYAIGEVIRRGIAFEKIVMRIHQPRPHHEEGSTRSWELSYSELLEYKEKIEARMDHIKAGEQGLQTGSQCKYCPAAAERCPAFNKMFYRTLEYVHEFVQDGITDEELSFQLDLINRANDVLKIKLDSLKALAIDRIKNNHIIPNYVNEPKYGYRDWKPDVDPEVIKMLTGIDIRETVLLSPAKAEKIGLKKDIVNAMVDRPYKGMDLVRKDVNETGKKIFNKESL